MPLLAIVPGGGAVLTTWPVNVVIALLAGYLVYRDATGRTASTPLLWGIGTAVASLALSFVGILLVMAAYYMLVIHQ